MYMFILCVRACVCVCVCVCVCGVKCAVTCWPPHYARFSGSNGLSVGQDAILNNDEDVGRTWLTVAEGLQAANITWKVYQSLDNFDDNAFEWFASFRAAKPGSHCFFFFSPAASAGCPSLFFFLKSSPPPPLSLTLSLTHSIR
jgi:hypothetical protein